MTEKPFAASKFWDSRYQDKDYIYGSGPNDFLRENAARFQAGDRVLSLAEGEGRNAVFLAQQGCRVTGVDFSAEGRKKAMLLAQQQGTAIDYAIADLTQYDMGEEAWDGIVSIFCHLAENARPAFYRSIRRGLKRGGLFLSEVYNKRQLEFNTGGPGDAAHLPSLEELKAAFEGFDIVLAQDTVREVLEGKGHKGRGSVTQIIVRKPLS